MLILCSCNAAWFQVTSAWAPALTTSSPFCMAPSCNSRVEGNPSPHPPDFHSNWWWHPGGEANGGKQRFLCVRGWCVLGGKGEGICFSSASARPEHKVGRCTSQGNYLGTPQPVLCKSCPVGKAPSGVAELMLRRYQRWLPSSASFSPQPALFFPSWYFSNQ